MADNWRNLIAYLDESIQQSSVKCDQRAIEIAAAILDVPPAYKDEAVHLCQKATDALLKRVRETRDCTWVERNFLVTIYLAHQMAFRSAGMMARYGE